MMSQPLGLAVVTALLLAASVLANVLGPEPDDTVAVRLTTALSARRRDLGASEQALGNLAADAIVAAVREDGKAIDCAVLPAWTLGYDSQRYRDGIIPAGGLSRSSLRRLVPFNPSIAVVGISGAELQGLLESGVAELPSGSFLQVSRELRVSIDLASRSVASLSIAGQPVDSNATYRVASTASLWRDWPGSRPTTLRNVASMVDAFSEFAMRRGVITPRLEGRIELIR
jgi:2',3'-cyclic-nucleotide 2'-phosphodiesterase (5'-nucleotidase family)